LEKEVRKEGGKEGGEEEKKKGGKKTKPIWLALADYPFQWSVPEDYLTSGEWKS